MASWEFMIFKIFLILALLPLSFINEAKAEGASDHSFFNKKTLSIMAGGTAATLLTYTTRKHYSAPLERNWGSQKPLGKYSRYGDYMGQLVPNALYIGEQLLFARPEGYRRSEHMFLATLYSALFTNVLKYTVREKRPSSNSKTSFPSGHTTTAFAFASVVSIHHPWYIGVPAYALATFVGVSRVNDKKHFIHDVLFGATIGTTFGYGTYYASGERYKVDKVSNFFVLPLIGKDVGGVVFNYSY